MSKCCLYTDIADKPKFWMTICTSDDTCPGIDGWERVDNWPVDKCIDCKPSNRPKKREIQAVTAELARIRARLTEAEGRLAALAEPAASGEE